MCGGVRIVHIRDVTTGYDSSQPDLKSVSCAGEEQQSLCVTAIYNGWYFTVNQSGTFE